MTHSIQNLPREILGHIFLNFHDIEDLIACTSACQEWHEAIKTNSISKRLIQSFFRGAGTSDTPNGYYSLLRALLLNLQRAEKFGVQSKDIDQLNALATIFKEMKRTCGYHDYMDHQTKISSKLKQLPTTIQEKLYHRLWKVCKNGNGIVNDCPEWGKETFHGNDHRRSLPSCSTRREVVLAQLEEQKLSILAATLVHGTSERSKEKAMKQFSQFPMEIKNSVYQKLEQLLTREGLFCQKSGKTAFYDSTVPKSLKGTAIQLFLEDLQD
jgi:hypothetical protein